MFKKAAKLLGAIALTGWMGVANATLIFDFSWDSDNGEIIGEITGMSPDGGIQFATGLVLTSVDGVAVDIDVFNDPGWNVSDNDLYVADNIITFFSFFSVRVDPLDSSWQYVEIYVGDSATYASEGREYAGTDIAFVNRVAVPEPSTVILLSLGLAGLSFARYRKQY
jgi:hypothetical protein